MNEEKESLERIADLQERQFKFLEASTRRLEMIVYPAILGMFIMFGIFAAVMFSMLSDLSGSLKEGAAAQPKAAIYAPIKNSPEL